MNQIFSQTHFLVNYFLNIYLPYLAQPQFSNSRVTAKLSGKMTIPKEKLRLRITGMTNYFIAILKSSHLHLSKILQSVLRYKFHYSCIMSGYPNFNESYFVKTLID